MVLSIRCIKRDQTNFLCKIDPPNRSNVTIQFSTLLKRLFQPNEIFVLPPIEKYFPVTFVKSLNSVKHGFLKVQIRIQLVLFESCLYWAKRSIRGVLREQNWEHWGFFSLGNRSHWAFLIVTSNCLKGAYKKHGERLFSRACGNRTGGDDFKLEEC